MSDKEKMKDTMEMEETAMDQEVSEELKEPQEEILTEPDQEESGEEKSQDKKGLFGKKKDKKDAQIEELTDRLKRSMAEFDNFRKRTEREKASMYEIGARDVIEKILPVVDNFERGLNAVPDDAKDSFTEGMEMIYKQLMKTLEDMGVKAIEAVGQPFDPNLHNAVMHIEDDSLGENVIAAELQKGYMYRETVIRHSMVQVAN
ncbi:MAG: nucleotide exchange factor GrpE [Lachnospiraceae bacterium]